MKKFISPSTQTKIKLGLSVLLIVMALLALLMPIANTPNAVAQEPTLNPTPHAEATSTPTVKPTQPRSCGETP